MAINRKNIVDQLLFGEGVVLSVHWQTPPLFQRKIKDDPYDLSGESST